MIYYFLVVLTFFVLFQKFRDKLLIKKELNQYLLALSQLNFRKLSINQQKKIFDQISKTGTKLISKFFVILVPAFLFYFFHHKINLNFLLNLSIISFWYFLFYFKKWNTVFLRPYFISNFLGTQEFLNIYTRDYVKVHW